MTFNTTKCKVLRMSKRSRRKPLNIYYLGKEVLLYFPETSDLGVSVSGNCTWNSYIEQVCEGEQDTWSGEETAWQEHS